MSTQSSLLIRVVVSQVLHGSLIDSLRLTLDLALGGGGGGRRQTYESRSEIISSKKSVMSPYLLKSFAGSSVVACNRKGDEMRYFCKVDRGSFERTILAEVGG